MQRAMRLGKLPCCEFKLFYFDLPHFCFNPWEETPAAEHISHFSRSNGGPWALFRLSGGRTACCRREHCSPAAASRQRAGLLTEQSLMHCWAPGGARSSTRHPVNNPRVLLPWSLYPRHCDSPGRARVPWSVGSHQLSAALGSGN